MRRTLAITATCLLIFELAQAQLKTDASASSAAAPQLQSKSLTPAETAELEEARQLSERVQQLSQRGRRNEALPLAERALRLRERVLGQNHVLVAEALSNLASLYVKKEGEPNSFEEALKATKVTSKDERRDTEKALALFGRALKIYERGPQPETERMQAALVGLEKLYDARLTHERELAYFVSTLKKTLRAQGGLSMEVYEPQVAKRRDESVAFYQRALALRERVLGQQHIEVARTLFKLAEIYRLDTHGDAEKAEPFYRRVLAILNVQPAAYQPESSFALRRYACFLRQRKRDDEALQLEARAYGFSTSGEGALRVLADNVLEGQAVKLPELSFDTNLLGLPVTQQTIPTLTTPPTVAYVIVDESGKVIHACPLTDDPVLWKEIEKAAYEASFKPMLVDGHAVKFAGRVTYKPAGKP
jgi:hypothetical protein